MKTALSIVVALAVCAFGHANATNYYLSPSGNDGRSGTSTTNAWASLQHARSHGLAAGDTLFVMGGTYSADNYFSVWDGSVYGAAGHPVVIKAYGDTPAIFTHSSSTFFQWGGAFNRGYITIDGFSRSDPDSAFWIRIRPDANSPAINISPGNASTFHYTNFTIRGVEIDGSNAGGALAYPFQLEGCDSFLVDHVYVHHVYHPTGNIAPGDGSNREQGIGECMFIKSCSAGRIVNSIFKYSNHGLISIEHTRVGFTGHESRYITIRNCLFENHWGGGLYLNFGTSYCLVEGNVFAHNGETTTFVKESMQISGQHNTIRKNVFYSPQNIGFELAGVPMVDGSIEDASYNYVYNNTFFENGKRQNVTYTLQTGGRVEHNVFANNLLYRPLDTASSYCPAVTNIWLNAGSATNNWYPTTTTRWGDNSFFNNCMRVDASGASYNPMVVYTQFQASPNDHFYTISALESDGTGQWANSIAGDPLMTSEDPDGYGLTRGWWRLRTGSPCIDRGMRVTDPNGAYVASNCPGYGWGSLAYQGSGPDIGAHEVGDEQPGPPVPPGPLSHLPGIH
jgi:hypothetical protein